MTVAGLIDRLERCEPDAIVRIMMQESWPFKNSIFGVSQRSDFSSDECECDQPGGEHDDDCPAGGEYGDPNLSANDIFTVEGTQERSGSRAAWEVYR